MNFHITDIDFIRIVPLDKNNEPLDNFNKAYHTMANPGFGMSILESHHSLIKTLNIYQIPHAAISAFETLLGLHLLTHLARFHVMGAQAVLKQIKTDSRGESRNYPEIARNTYRLFVNEGSDFTPEAITEFGKAYARKYPQVLKQAVKIADVKVGINNYLTDLTRLNLYYNYQVLDATDHLAKQLTDMQVNGEVATSTQVEQLQSFIKVINSDFLISAMVAPTFNNYIKEHKEIGCKPEPRKTTLKLL